MKYFLSKGAATAILRIVEVCYKIKKYFLERRRGKR
jgi:hypothetical protein